MLFVEIFLVISCVVGWAWLFGFLIVADPFKGAQVVAALWLMLGLTTIIFLAHSFL